MKDGWSGILRRSFISREVPVHEVCGWSSERARCGGRDVSFRSNGQVEPRSCFVPAVPRPWNQRQKKCSGRVFFFFHLSVSRYCNCWLVISKIIQWNPVERSENRAFIRTSATLTTFGRGWRKVCRWKRTQGRNSRSPSQTQSLHSVVPSLRHSSRLREGEGERDRNVDH